MAPLEPYTAVTRARAEELHKWAKDLEATPRGLIERNASQIVLELAAVVAELAGAIALEGGRLDNPGTVSVP